MSDLNQKTAELQPFMYAMVKAPSQKQKTKLAMAAAKKQTAADRRAVIKEARDLIRKYGIVASDLE
jgi:hypothetical protein